MSVENVCELRALAQNSNIETEYLEKRLLNLDCQIHEANKKVIAF